MLGPPERHCSVWQILDSTACSNADTGVGATIALGSQPWNGITADFTLTPTTSIRTSPHAVVFEIVSSASSPPATNDPSMPSICTHAVPPISSSPSESVYIRYLRPARIALSVSRCVTNGYVTNVSSS